MLNILELEKRWTTYKIKTIAPIIIAIFALLIVAGSVAYTIKQTRAESKLEHLNNIAKASETNTTTYEVNDESQFIDENLKQEVQTTDTNESIYEIQSTEIIEESIIENKIIKEKNSNKEHEKIIITPSFEFIENIEKNIPADDVKTHIKQPEHKQEIQKKQEPTKTDSSTINIQKQNSEEDIEHVLQRFAKNNNPALTLFVAKKYYELGEYDKAYNYALMTNSINNNIEESWIIFAKSLVKLGKKDMAIKTLKQYIEYSNSNKAIILLDKILSGKPI